MVQPDPDTIRLDLWLFHARFYKSRALAAAAITGGRFRINGQVTSKAHRTVRPGDVLTFVLAGRVRVIRVEAPGTRRGPAPEARQLYADLDAPAATAPPETGG
jgi:ribosome-associated heat shock protein Hsp15